MILILSNDYEASTFNVVEWLHYFKSPVEVITEFWPIKKISYYIDKNGKAYVKLYSNNKEVDFDKVKFVWYRRGKFIWGENPELYLNNSEYKFIGEHIISEKETLNNTLFHELKSKKHFGSYLTSSPNKLYVLKMAAKVGLHIPETLITCEKNDIYEKFKGRHVINKNISEIIQAQIGNTLYYNRTVRLMRHKFPRKFFPSLIQTEIIKKYELRIFFIRNIFFASAIFSQRKKTTEVDFREYDYHDLNRTVPFLLPLVIRKKLLKLMMILELDTGSIDMIVTEDNKFVFLEVNPVGQFGMISYPCNFNLEKIFARNLLGI